MVYTNAGSLWIVEGDNPPRQLTSGGPDSDPVFSPDGRWILFQRQLSPVLLDIPRFELRVIGVDGRGDRLVVGPEDLPGLRGELPSSDTEVLFDRQPLQVAWLPDNRTVAFNTTVGVTWGSVYHDDLWLVDVETGAPRQLLPDGEGGVFAFSPDGTRLVASTSTTVIMMDADGGNRRTLVTFDPVVTYSAYAYHPQPVWTPDGSYALVVVASPDPLGPDASGNLWRLPLTGDATLLRTLSGDFLHNTQGDTLRSSDRTRIAYTVPVEGGELNERDLVIAEGDGSNPVVYARGKLGLLDWTSTAEPGFWSGWNPDNRRFVWQDLDQLKQVVYLGQVGGPPVQLLPPGEKGRIYLLRWVDVDTFVYVTNEQGAYTLRLGQVGGVHRTIGTSEDDRVQLDIHP